MPKEELSSYLKSKRLAIGSKVTLRQIKLGNIVKVYLASNSPRRISEDLARYARQKFIALEVLDIPNDELGILCKRPFSVSTIGLLRQ